MENKENSFIRAALATLGLIGLASVFIFQYTDVLRLLGSFSPEVHFIVNRICRIFINDLCMLAIIYALFPEKKVLQLALLIQAADLLVLLPLYLILKLPNEGITELSSPFLSQLHRLIVNPTLMILLIPAVYYQKNIVRAGKQ